MTDNIGKIFVISGITCSGKDTIINTLVESSINLFRPISMTTRPPKPHETPGVHYHFVSRNEFERMIQDGELLEYDDWGSGHYYGTPRKPVEDALNQGKNVLVDQSRGGMLKMKENIGSDYTIQTVYVLAPSLATLYRRGISRGDKPQQVRTRLERAKRDIRTGVPLYDHILVNDVLNETLTAVEQWVTDSVIQSPFLIGSEVQDHVDRLVAEEVAPNFLDTLVNNNASERKYIR